MFTYVGAGHTFRVPVAGTRAVRAPTVQCGAEVDRRGLLATGSAAAFSLVTPSADAADFNVNSSEWEAVRHPDLEAPAEPGPIRMRRSLRGQS